MTARRLALAVALVAACTTPDPPAIVTEDPALVSAKTSPPVARVAETNAPAGVTPAPDEPASDEPAPDAGVPDAAALGIPPDQDCFGLYYGYGGPKDLRAARACFARDVAEQGPCGGSSPSLERLFLLVMRVDGQGGPVNHSLDVVDGCHEDVSLAGIGYVRAQRPHGPLDYCHHFGGTTQSMNRCTGIDLRRAMADDAEVQARLVAKVGQGEAIAAATTRMLHFTSAAGRSSSDVYRHGSMRLMADGQVQIHLYELRTALLRELAHGQVDPGAGGDVASAYRRALDGVRDATHRRLLETAQRQWQRYAGAELAWVRAAGLPVAAVRTRLEGERTRQLNED